MHSTIKESLELRVHSLSILRQGGCRAWGRGSGTLVQATRGSPSSTKRAGTWGVFARHQEHHCEGWRTPGPPACCPAAVPSPVPVPVPAPVLGGGPGPGSEAPRGMEPCREGMFDTEGREGKGWLLINSRVGMSWHEWGYSSRGMNHIVQRVGHPRCAPRLAIGQFFHSSVPSRACTRMLSPK